MRGKRQKDAHVLNQGEAKELERVQMFFSYVDQQGESVKERVRKMAKDKMMENQQVGSSLSEEIEQENRLAEDQPEVSARAEELTPARAEGLRQQDEAGGENAGERKGERMKAFRGKFPKRRSARRGGSSSGKRRWIIGAATAASVVFLAVFSFVYWSGQARSDNQSGSVAYEESKSMPYSPEDSYNFVESDSTASPSSVEIADQTLPSIDNSGTGSGSMGSNIDSGNTAGGSTEETMGQKIIYTASATIGVDDLTQAMQGIEEKVKAIGGYVARSSYAGKDTSASMVLKIPSEKYAEFNDGLTSWGNVVNMNQSSEDIGQKYFDIDTRLKAAEAQEQRYLEILKDAKSLDEILKVEKALSEMHTKIESYKGQLRYWDNQVGYSQVTLTLQRKQDAISIDNPWTPVSFSKTLETCRNALLKTVSTLWNILNTFLVVLAYLLPILIPGGIVWWGVRRVLRQRRLKRQAVKVPQEEPGKDEGDR